jgi:hypothetical protein
LDARGLERGQGAVTVRGSTPTHPVPGQTDPSNLFISSNYVLTLKANRTSLPEYARFAGPRCEVQVQTTLNHAWSEMEHDIIYKKPMLPPSTGQGAKNMDPHCVIYLVIPAADAEAVHNSAFDRPPYASWHRTARMPTRVDKPRLAYCEPLSETRCR